VGPALRALRPALAFFHRLWERHPACYRELNAVSIGFALAARQMASIRVRGRGWIRGPGQPNTVGSLSGPLLAGHHGGASKFATEVPHFSEAAVWRVVNSEHEGRAPEARARMGPERCELSWTASRRAGQSTTSSSGHLWSIGLTGAAGLRASGGNGIIDSESPWVGSNLPCAVRIAGTPGPQRIRVLPLRRGIARRVPVSSWPHGVGGG